MDIHSIGDVGAASAENGIQLGIDIAALFIGIFAVVIILKVNRVLGGRINQALRYFIAGIVCNLLAIVWSLVFVHTYLVGGFHIDIHQNLMSVGLIFFIISTIKFSKLLQNV